MKANIRYLVIMAAMLIIAIGCSSFNSRSSMPSVSPAPPPMGASAGIAQNKATDSTNFGPTASVAAAETVPDDRKIVRTGTIAIEVPDIGKALDQVTGVAAQFNGYVVNSNQYGETNTPYGNISIRVPAGKFDDAFQKIKDIANKVTNESTNSQDVTEQYVDLKAQLHNFEATETQYLELLKKADTVKDMLEVQRELSNVRSSSKEQRGASNTSIALPTCP